MMNYPWAQNRSKLERAIGELGPDASEEALKARYIEMAGLVLDEPVVSLEKEAPKKAKKK